MSDKIDTQHTVRCLNHEHRTQTTLGPLDNSAIHQLAIFGYAALISEKLLISSIQLNVLIPKPLYLGIRRCMIPWICYFQAKRQIGLLPTPVYHKAPNCTQFLMIYGNLKGGKEIGKLAKSLPDPTTPYNRMIRRKAKQTTYFMSMDVKVKVTYRSLRETVSKAESSIVFILLPCRSLKYEHKLSRKIINILTYFTRAWTVCNVDSHWHRIGMPLYSQYTPEYDNMLVNEQQLLQLSLQFSGFRLKARHLGHPFDEKVFMYQVF